MNPQTDTVSRLISEYHRHGSLVIAFDFDHTLFDTYGYTSKESLTECLFLLKRCIWTKQKVFIWTANDDFDLVRSIVGNNIPINESPVEFNNSRKPFYSYLLDDRAGLWEAMETLDKVLSHIELDRKLKQ